MPIGCCRRKEAHHSRRMVGAVYRVRNRFIPINVFPIQQPQWRVFEISKFCILAIIFNSTKQWIRNDLELVATNYTTDAPNGDIL